MKHKLVLATASVFSMFGVVSVAHGTSLEDVCNASPITEDTKVTHGGDFSGDCLIEVDNARLEIRGVTIAITAANGDDGELRIDDVTMEDVIGDERDNGEYGGNGEYDGGAELIIKNCRITTDDRLRIEGPWDEGVTFKNNLVVTGDDLRVKPIGSGDLVFKYNRGKVVDDVRLGDVIKEENDDVIVGGLLGDIDVRYNRIILVEKEEDDPTEFIAQSFEGDIDIRYNRLGNRVEKVDITSKVDIESAESGDIVVKYNIFQNPKTPQEIIITSDDGDVGVWKNKFGRKAGPVTIESTNGECEAERNRPDIVNTLACP